MRVTISLFRKNFASVKTFNQHVESKKHNPNMIKSQEKAKPKMSVFKKNKNVCIFCQE